MNLFMISWYVIDLFLQSSIDVKRYPLSLDRILIAAVFENQVTRKVACNEYFKTDPKIFVEKETNSFSASYMYLP